MYLEASYKYLYTVHRRTFLCEISEWFADSEKRRGRRYSDQRDRIKNTAAAKTA